MPKTSKFDKKTIVVPQHGTNWCIPASIENLLKSEGCHKLTQEDIIYEFLLQTAPIQKLSNGQEIDLRLQQRFQVLELFRCPPLPDASFQTFAPIVNTLLNNAGVSLTLKSIDNISSNDYVKEVEGILSLDKAVLISAGHASGWHITVVYESNGNKILSYDPGKDSHLDMPVSSYSFSHDLLYID